MRVFLIGAIFACLMGTSGPSEAANSLQSPSPRAPQVSAASPKSVTAVTDSGGSTKENGDAADCLGHENEGRKPHDLRRLLGIARVLFILATEEEVA